MDVTHRPTFSISPEVQGPTTIAKASFPLRYGTYSEIKTSDYEFRFNLNGEIKFIRGLNVNWPHPAEQIKRTDGNDWVYYTVGGPSNGAGVVAWMGEYYLPCLPYPSNAVWEINYFSNPSVMEAFAAWSQLYANLHSSKGHGIHPNAKKVVASILENNDMVLHERSRRLHHIIGGQVSVLPPDTRHLDYEVIPLTIADGCRYHCRNCCVKTPQTYQPRSKTDITEQIERLKRFYQRNLDNYHGLFLGQHDGLAAGKELITFAASKAAEMLRLADRGDQRKPLLFLFGSIDALLNSPHRLLEKINRLPFYTYINIGFESIDPQTLNLFGKPVSTSQVQDAYQKMISVNDEYEQIEITGNFLLGQQLSEQHHGTLQQLLAETTPTKSAKGTIYLSPLKNSPKKRELLPLFFKITAQSRLPTFIYLIQRL